MAHTYHELKEKTLQELREIALCTALGIDAHEHAVVVGIDKPALKAKMHELQKARDAALDKHDAEALKAVRRQLHHLNHQIRAHRAHVG
jgi:CHASE3 domain sensor protein